MNNNLDILIKIKDLKNKYMFFFYNLIDILQNNHPNTYETLNDLYNEYSFFNEKCIHMNMDKNALSSIQNIHLQNINDIINNKIMKICNHEFIEDDIDISPDYSQRITYCLHCENSLEDCKKNGSI
jgi:hypothetical protein